MFLLLYISLQIIYCDSISKFSVLSNVGNLTAFKSASLKAKMPKLMNSLAGRNKKQGSFNSFLTEPLKSAPKPQEPQINPPQTNDKKQSKKFTKEDIQKLDDEIKERELQQSHKDIKNIKPLKK